MMTFEQHWLHVELGSNPTRAIAGTNASLDRTQKC
jgi:hypothetical protein